VCTSQCTTVIQKQHRIFLIISTLILPDKHRSSYDVYRKAGAWLVTERMPFLSPSHQRCYMRKNLADDYLKTHFTIHWSICRPHLLRPRQRAFKQEADDCKEMMRCQQTDDVHGGIECHLSSRQLGRLRKQTRQHLFHLQCTHAVLYFVALPLWCSGSTPTVCTVPEWLPAWTRFSSQSGQQSCTL